MKTWVKYFYAVPLLSLKISFILLGLCFSLALKAQTNNLGKPVGATNKYPLPEKAVYQLPSIDNDEQQAYYAKETQNTGYKIGQYGTPHELKLDFFDFAEQRILPNGNTLYQLRIKSLTAISLNVIFSTFRLEEGTTLHLITSGGTDYVGAYTSLNNNKANSLGTDVLYANDIIIEVNEPIANKNKSNLEISRIVHGFTHLGKMMNKALNSSGSCNIDVNCPQGSGWEICRNSVGMIMNSTGGFCSGSLINNTSGNIIPYFLTANHCGTDPTGWVFRFRWESPADQVDCGTSVLSVNGPDDYNINGGILRASSDQSDFKLIELNTVPDESWEVIYAGWDRGPQEPQNSTGIHHPAGDIKKISLSYVPSISTTYVSGFTNGHWKVFWNEGVTEGGSSGSPLFDQSRRIVGQLSGGASGCLSSDQSDSYGKFFRSWTGKGTIDTRLSDWLDPGNLGNNILDANVQNTVDPMLNPAVLGLEKPSCTGQINASVILTNGGTTPLTSATINYSFDWVNYSFEWTGNLGLFESDTVEIPTHTVNSQIHVFQASVANPNGSLTDQITTNNSVVKPFYAIVFGGTYLLELNLDCYAGETSWEITDLNNNVIHESPAYFSTGSPETIVEEVCLTDNCYFFKIYDKLGDGLSSGFCQSGSYYFTDPITLDTMFFLAQADADFGNSKVTQFCPVYASINEVELNPLNVYPNPFEDNFTVSSGSLIEEISLFDLSGKMIYQRQNCHTNKEIVDFQLNNGSYLIQVKTAESVQMRRILKIN